MAQRNEFGSWNEENHSSRYGKSEPLGWCLTIQISSDWFYLNVPSPEDSKSEPSDINLMVRTFQLYSRVILINVEQPNRKWIWYKVVSHKIAYLLQLVELNLNKTTILRCVCEDGNWLRKTNYFYFIFREVRYWDVSLSQFSMESNSLDGRVRNFPWKVRKRWRLLTKSLILFSTSHKN